MKNVALYLAFAPRPLDAPLDPALFTLIYIDYTIYSCKNNVFFQIFFFK